MLMPVAPRFSAVTSSMEWLPLLGGGYGTTGMAVMEIYEKNVSPQTSDGCVPALTTRYEAMGVTSIIDTGHYPMAAVIEYYEISN